MSLPMLRVTAPVLLVRERWIIHSKIISDCEASCNVKSRDPAVSRPPSRLWTWCYALTISKREPHLQRAIATDIYDLHVTLGGINQVDYSQM